MWYILIMEGKNPNGSIGAGIDFTVIPAGEPSGDDYIIRNSGLTGTFSND